MHEDIINEFETSVPIGARSDIDVKMFDESALKDLSESDIALLDAQLQASTLDQSLDYGEPDYLLYQNGIGFMPRGDIQAIKAQQKNGKSMLMDYFMGTMLRDDGKYGCLECPHRGLKVLYVDTEMQKRNTSLQSKRVHTICGWPVYELHDNFQILTLRGQGEEICRKLVERMVQLMKPDAVFIDGIKDLCTNFNDLEESAKLIRWEMNISTLYNCAVCSILHVNPNSDKMRGHLGTEEQNKCSDVFTVLKSKKEGGTQITFKVKQTDARNRDIEDFDFVCQNDRYGTPISPAIEVETEEKMSFTMTKASKGQEATISFTHNTAVDVLTFFHDTLTMVSGDAPARSNLIKLFRKGNPILGITSDEKADAWIEWAIQNNYLVCEKGAHNANVIRWKQGAVVPLKDTESTGGEVPF